MRPTIPLPPDTAERVREGIAWLNANRPGWRDRLNPQALDMHCPGGCALGQADARGNYYEALREIPEAKFQGSYPPNAWAITHGFALPLDYGTAEYMKLTELWVQTLEEIDA